MERLSLIKGYFLNENTDDNTLSESIHSENDKEQDIEEKKKSDVTDSLNSAAIVPAQIAEKSVDIKLAKQESKESSKKKTINRFLALFMILLIMLCTWAYIDIMREGNSISDTHFDPRFVYRSKRKKLMDISDYKLNHENKLVPKKLPHYVNDDFATNISAIIGNAIKVPERTISSLPRTSNRQYNQLEDGERYFIYSPSGGFTNQLYCFLSAVYVAKMTNRTLLVPPKGRHSNMFWGYYKLTQPNVIPMDHALDFPFMEKAMGVRLLPLNITLASWQKTVLRGTDKDDDLVDFVRIEITGGMRKASHKYQENFVKKVAKSNKKVVWGYGKFYSKYLGVIKGKLANHVRFAPYLIQFSKVISREFFNNTFNAFHIRLGDYSSKATSVSSNARAFVSASKKIGFKRETPVYLATDSNSKLYFKPLYKQFHGKVIKGQDLKTNPVVNMWLKDFYTRLPPTTIRQSLFGLVDQLICARAQKYVGTLISTFSRVIVYHRDNIETVLPDMINDTNHKFDRTERASILAWWGGGSKSVGKEVGIKA